MSSTISPGMHPVISALRIIDTGLDELAEGNLWSLLDSEALEVRVELERLAARLYGAKLASTRDVDSRGAAVKAGASSLRAWLINKVRLHPGEASREVVLATRLDTDLPATAAALAAGAITPAAAAVIADSDAKLRKVATAAQRADAEALLVEFAETIPVGGLQHAAIHLGNRLGPDQGQRLAEEEEAQVARREFRLTPNPDGSSRPGGYLDKEATALLRTALDPLAKPRPAADAIPDPRSPAQRTGDALVELVELALRAGDLPTQAGQPVQLVVTIGLKDLESRLARALNGDGPGAGTFHHSPTSSNNRTPDEGLLPDEGLFPDVFAAFGAHFATPAPVAGSGCWTTVCRCPPPPCAAGHVTASSSRSCSAPTANPSTSDGRHGSRPRRSGAPWTPGTAAARSPAATGRPNGASATTSCTGKPSEKPPVRTWCCSADTTTASSTTTAGTSTSPQTDCPPSTHPPGSTPTDNPDATPASHPTPRTSHHRTDTPPSSPSQDEPEPFSIRLRSSRHGRTLGENRARLP